MGVMSSRSNTMEMKAALLLMSSITCLIPASAMLVQILVEIPMNLLGKCKRFTERAQSLTVKNDRPNEIADLWPSCQGGQTRTETTPIGITAGFDGVYLDRIDVYWERKEDRATSEEDVITFIRELTAYAKALKPDFPIVPQKMQKVFWK